MRARQDHLRYVGDAMARMGGDCGAGQNAPVYLSPATLGHLTRLAALPWCADAAANPTRARSKVRGGSKCSRGFLNGLGEESANDGIDESTKEQAVVVAPRRLLAFVDPEAQEEFRRQVMYGCC